MSHSDREQLKKVGKKESVISKKSDNSRGDTLTKGHSSFGHRCAWVFAQWPFFSARHKLHQKFITPKSVQLAIPQRTVKFLHYVMRNLSSDLNLGFLRFLETIPGTAAKSRL